MTQGSNLGLLLFSVSINDLGRILMCFYLFFADDAKLFLPISEMKNCTNLQHNVDLLYLCYTVEDAFKFNY